MKNSKILSVILLCTMILASIPFASCSDNSVEKIETTTAVSESSVTEEGIVTEEPRDMPEMMTGDYGGAVFNVLYPNWSLYNSYYFAEDESGDAVNDAIYTRTQKLEEALNIDFQWTTKGYIDTIYKEVNKTVMAGLSTYDLALTHCVESLPSFVSSGCVIDWNKIPNIDMSKDYWNSSVKQNMELAGVLPFASNAFILPDVNSLFFNSDMITNYALESPYDLVTSGKWTWDVLAEMSTAVSKDIDGDGQFTMSDRYGLMGELGWQCASMVTSCDVYVIHPNADGVSELTLNNEKLINLIDKLSTMRNASGSAYFWLFKTEYDPNQGGKPPIGFDEGNALFYLVPLSLAANFRAMEIEFGIIPLPKYDENQDDYLTLNWAGFMCVPMTAADPARVGAVVEMLGYMNNEYVVPAFYDVLLGQKISRDEKSVQMLDIIFENSIYDLGINLGIYNTLYDTLNPKSKPFASYYESNLKNWTNTMDKYYTAHEEYAAKNR